MIDRIILDVQLRESQLARETVGLTSGVKPELNPVFGDSTGSSSTYRQSDGGRDSISLRLMTFLIAA